MMKTKAPLNPQDYKGAIVFFGITSLFAIGLSVWKIGEVFSQF